MSRDCIRFRWNDRSVELRGFSPRTMLLDWLRLEQRATGTKEGCNEGDCGACTVVAVRHRDGRLNYEPINSCICFLGQLDGAELITVENLASGHELHPVQAALARDHGSQCGFCTPGIVMSVFAHYHSARHQADVAGINDALAGNLCRCTGYRPIVDAAMEACDGDPSDKFSDHEQERTAAITALADDADVLVGNSSSFFAAPAHEESLADLYQAHPDATVVAGATDVGLWVTKKLAPIEKILHVGRVASLHAIEESADVISFGAAVSLERAAARLGALDPDIAEVMRRFGSRQVRASGTIGGNVANGSPIGDLPPILIVLGATVELQKGQTRRLLPVEAFFLAYGKQDRAPGEFVRRIIVPKPGANTRLRVFKVSKRTDEDISAVLGAFRFDVDNERISKATIAFGGMAGTPKRAENVEQKLQGAAIGDTDAWRVAMDSLSQDFQPLTDARASASYRLSTARNLLFKALAECAGAPSGSTRVSGRAEATHVQH